MIVRYALRSLLLLSIIVESAPPAAAKRKHPADSNYILTFPGTITVRTYLGEKISTFRITDGARNENLQFRPNNILSLGAGVTIRGIGLNFSTRLPLHDPKIDKYGRTRRLDIQVHRYNGNLLLDVYAQRYRGYHLNEKTDVSEVYGSTEYPYYADLQTVTVGATGMYLFNGERYSLRAMVNQQEWQIRSAGSFMLGGGIFTHFVSNLDSSIIPSNLAFSDFLDSSLLNKINTYGITVNGGYGYNYIYKQHWFASISGDVGAGLGYTEVKEMDGTYKNTSALLLNTNGRAGAGYNSKKWFAGFYAIYRTDMFPMPYDRSVIRLSEGLFRIVVARRLQTGKRDSKLSN